MAIGIVAAQSEQIGAICFSRVDVIAGIRGRIRAFRAIWTAPITLLRAGENAEEVSGLSVYED